MNCPYCDTRIVGERELDFKCKFCRNIVYVRVQPASRVMDYFTKQEAEKFDKMMDKTLESFKDKFKQK